MASNASPVVVHESSSDSDDEAEIPSAEVCQERCEEFAMVTTTDSALAMMYLQQNGWVLEQALNKYFQDQGEEFSDRQPEASSKNNNHKTKNETSTTAAGSAASSTIQAQGQGDSATDSSMAKLAKKDENPFRIKILSWNLDGLDLNNIQTRTTAACKTISELNPDVVYLQEVVPPSLEMISALMDKTFLCIAADDQSYFTMILLNRATVMHESHEVIPFYSSKMGRNILECDANIKGIPFHLMTSHLESTGPHKEERVRQMKKCIQRVCATDKSKIVVFGGDLNARDKEVATVNIPVEVVDIWEYCGQRKEAKFTWDMMRNDNLEMSGNFRARCRFDRFYFRPDEKKSAKPVYFELVGLERIPSCRRFISDHWGMLAHFNIST